MRWMTEIKSFEVEEKVYLRMNNIHMQWKSKKLNNKSIKQFKIKRNIKKLSYEINLLKKMWIHSVFHAFMHSCYSVAISSYHFKPLKCLSNLMKNMKLRTF